MMYGWTWNHWPGMGPGWGGLLMLLIWLAAVAGAVVLARWLRDAHTVDGIVKGLKQPDWPADPWMALQQLAMRVAQACAAR